MSHSLLPLDGLYALHSRKHKCTMPRKHQRMDTHKGRCGFSKGDRKLYLVVFHVDGSNHLMHSVKNLRSVFGKVLECRGVEERDEVLVVAEACRR